MKKIILNLLAILAFACAHARNYNCLLNYSNNGAPTYGLKIVTNLPHTSGSQMPTISIKGYSFGTVT